ncbi:Ig-like domain-containing protein [Amphritea sp. HPY]|uniref:Ig-like domain-containing protein n=1 Tax=Amphritea sp. HPY TaxID=3421652 RepID=UPI003D7C866A
MDKAISAEVSVVEITGDVVVVDAQGVERVLVPGDKVQSGAMVITPAQGSIALNTGKTAPETVPEKSAAMVEVDPKTGEITLAIHALENESPDVASIQQAILAGQDPTEVLEETAAGNTEPQNSGFSEFEDVDRTAQEVIANAGFDTTGTALDLVKFPEYEGEFVAASTLATIIISGPATVAEGEIAEYVVSLNQPALTEMVVTVVTGFIAGGADADDLVPVTQDVVIAAGQVSGSLSVVVNTLDDAYLEGAEGYQVSVAGFVGGGFDEVESSSVVSTVILDGAGSEPGPDPVDTATLTLSGPATVAEGEAATYSLSIDKAPATDMTVTVVTGYVVNGADSDDLTPVTQDVVIKAGTTVGMTTVVVNTTDDAYLEGPEGFQVKVDGVTGGGFENVDATTVADTDILDGNGNEPGPDPEDTAILTLSGPATVAEGEAATYTLSIDKAPATDMTVTVVTGYVVNGADSDDLTAVTQDVVIKAGTTAGITSIVVSTTDDATLEGPEGFQVKVDSFSGGSFENVDASTVADTDIVDGNGNEPGPDPADTVYLQLHGNDSVIEGDGETLSHTIDLVKAEDGLSFVSLAVGELIEVTLSYTPVGGIDVIVPEDLISQQVTVTIIGDGGPRYTIENSVFDDGIVEGVEGYTLKILSINPANTSTSFENLAIDPNNNRSEGRIIDNDSTNIAVDSVTVVEGEDSFAEFTVSLTQLSVDDVTVDLTLADGSAPNDATKNLDYGSETELQVSVDDGVSWQLASTVTIAAGKADVLVRVPVNEDFYKEGDETFSLIATETTSVTVNGGASGTGTIQDAGSPGNPEGAPTPEDTVYLQLSGNDTVTEGDGNALQHSINLVAADGLTPIALSVGKTIEITLSYAPIAGVDAVEAADLDPQLVTVTIVGDGTSSYTIDNAVFDDSLIESTEGYVVQITGINQANSNTSFENVAVDINNNRAEGRIIDNDPPVIEITPPGDGATPAITDDINRTYESGLDDNDGSESTSGSFTVTAADGLGSIAIDGTTVTTGDSVTHSGIGILTVGTIVDNGNGTYTVNYSYDLSAVQTHSAAGNDVVTDTFSVTAVDGDGTPTATASTITIEIVDDVPVAAVDTASTTENTQVTYNVINNDDAGADGGKVLVSASLADNTKGSLSFDTATGEISFTPALGVADEDVVINYTMRDADGDVSNSTLTVSVGADSVPTITTTPPDDNGTADITDDINRTYESGLDDNDGSESTSGSFTVTAPDGLGSIAIDGTTVTTGDSVTHSGIGILTVGTIVDNGNGTYTVNYSYDLSAVQTHSAAGNDVVTDTFSVTAVDGDGTPTATASTITIEIVDDVPVAAVDTASTTENTQVTYNVINNDDAGADGGKVLVSASLADNTKGSLSFDTATGEISFTPALGVADEDVVINYTMRDADGDVSNSTLTVSVGADSVPTITTTPPDDNGTADITDDINRTYESGLDDNDGSESTSGSFTVTAPDGLGSIAIDGTTVTTGDSVTHSGIGILTVGTIVDNGNGTYTVNYSYDLSAVQTHSAAGNDVVTDTFSVTAVDGDGTPTATASTITIEIVDDVPVAAVDTASTTENTQVTYNVINNDDAGADGGKVLVSASLADNTKGSLSFDTATGEISFTPALGVADEDVVINYTMRDADGDVSNSTLTVSVGADSVPTITTTPPDDNGTADITDDINRTYESGLDDNDGSESTSGSFTVTAPDGLGSIAIDGTTVTTGDSVTHSGIGILTVGTIVDNGNGTYTVNYSYDLSAVQTHSAAGNDVVTDTFSVTAVDGDGTPTATASTITIEIVDDVPVAAVDTASTTENTQVTYNVINNDDAGADGGKVLVSASLADNTKGSLSFDTATGEISFTPALGVADEDVVINYTMRDADGDVSNSTLTVSVGADSVPTITTTPPDDNGTADITDDINRTYESGLDDNDGSESTSGSFTVTAPDGLGSIAIDGTTVTTGDSVTHSGIGILTVGTIVDNGNGTYTVNYSYDLSAVQTHSAAGNDVVTDTFSVTAVDGDGTPTATASTITIEIVDDVPVAAVDTASTTENTQVTYNVINNDDAGADGGKVLVSASLADNTKGSLSFDTATGEISFTPALGVADEDVVINYTMRDADGDVSNSTLTVSVGADSVPTITTTPPDDNGTADITDDINRTYESGLDDNDGSESTSGSFTVTAPDGLGSIAIDGTTVTTGDSVTHSGIGILTVGTIVDNGNGTYTVNYSYDLSAVQTHSAAGNDVVTDTFSVTAVDGDGTPTATASTITIEIVDDVPVAAVDTASTTENTQVTYNVINNDDAGADGGKVLVSASLADNTKGSLSFDTATGEISFTPALGVADEDVVINYTMRDADGDVSNSTLTVSVGADSVPTITTTPPDDNGTADITDDINRTYESGLDDNDGSESTSGSFTVTAPDGLGSIAIDGTTVTTGDSVTHSGIGILTVGTIVDNGNGTYTVNYSYDLSAVQTHSAAGNDVVTDTFSVTAVDGDGTPTATASTITIEIVDDVPVAAVDTASTTENTQVTYNVINNDDAGADGGKVLVSASLADNTKGSLSFDTATGEISFTPALGVADEDVVINYTMRDADGDVSNSTLTVSVGADSVPTITTTPPDDNGTADITDDINRTYESGLDDNDGSESTSGSFTVTAPDGLGSIAIDGTTVTTGDSVTHSGIGILTVGTIVDNGNGTYTVNYSYDLSAVQTHSAAGNDVVTDTFSVTAVDGDGTPTATASTITIEIVDDVPVAAVDTASTTENTQVTYNVINNDDAGADGGKVLVSASLADNTKGSLSFDTATGEISFTPALGVADEDVVINYTMRDADGDVSNSTLTVSVGADSVPTITTTPPDDNGTADITDDINRTYESGLDDNDGSESTSGSFTVTAPDGLGSIAIDGTTVTTGDSVTHSGIGILTVGTIVDNGNGTYTVNYSYDLSAVQTHSAAGNDVVTDTFSVTAVDGDGTPTATASTITIEIVDDVPVAAVDTASTTENTQVTYNVINNDDAGADGGKVLVSASLADNTKGSLSFDTATGEISFTPALGVADEDVVINYTMRDADGDVSNSTLTVSVGADSVPTITTTPPDDNGTADITDDINRTYESGLDDNDGSESTSGSFTVTAPDGLGSIAIDGTTVTTGDSVTHSGIGILTVGTIVDNGNGTYTVNYSYDLSAVQTHSAAGNDVVTDTFSVTAVDGDGTPTATASTITIEIVDDVPVAAVDTASTTENTQVTYNVINNDDAGADGGKVLVSASLADNTKGSLSFDTATGEISFTPALGVADEDVVINYTMRDADGDVSNSTLTVSVGADSVPTITTTPPDDNGTADITDDINRTYESGLDDNDGSESTSGSFTVTAPDGLGSIAIDGTTVTTGDSVTHSGIGILTVGTIVDNGNGTYTVNYSYDLSAVQTHSAAGNDVVTDTFSVTAVDGDGTPTATASTITIEIVDDVPVAAVDTASTTENTQVTYNVINNDDAGADGGKVLVSASLADNTKGSLSFDTATGEISFTPALGVADEDVVINYTMRDADGDVSNSTLTVSVGADSVPTITTTPPDDNGTADITDDINRTYESGLDDNDGSESTSGSFTVTAPDGLGSIAIDGTTVTTGDSVTHSGIGILTVGTIVDNGNGTYTVNYSYDLSAVQTHSAAGNDVVTDTFSVTAVDGDGTPTATASTITIEIVDDVPVAAVDTASTTENTQVTYNVINNDDAGADGGKVLVSASLADNTKGSLSFDTATGEISFTPALGVADEDVVINYTMRDADGDVSNSTLTVSVGADSVPTITTTPPDDNGTADITDDINRTYESGLDDNDGSESTSGSFTVTAPDGLGSIAIDGTTVTTGDSVTHSGIGILTVGTIVDNGNGTYTVNYSYDLSAVQTHSAAGNDVVTDTFSVTAVDGDGTPTATASTITIEIVDDVPVAAVDTASTTENTQVTYNVINNDDAGADGGKVLVSASLADNTKGSLSFDTATGEISFTPALGVADEDVVINYTMRDADGDVSNSTLTVSVGADSVPTITTTPPDDNGTADITDDINRTYESGLDDNDGSESTSGSFTVTAPDGLGSIAIDGTTVTTGDSVTHSGIGILTVGTIVDNGNGTYTVNYSYDLSAVQTHSAAGNDVVTDTFSVTAVDGDGTPTATASTITIEIVDDVPVAAVDTASTTENTQVTYNVINNDDAGADGGKVLVSASLADNTKGSLSFDTATGEISFTPALGVADEDVVINYTMRDADGDVSNSTLTVSVGADSVPTITTTPPDDNGTADITDDINRTYESGLDDNDGSESTSGSFTVTAPDGLGSIAIDGTTVTTGDSVTHSGIGILTVGTIVDNGNGTYTVNYSYDLSAVQTHSAAGNDVVTDTFSVTAVDGDGTPTATASTITIEIVDDVPVAAVDTASTTENTQVTYNVINNDDAGADGGKVLVSASLADNTKGSLSFDTATGEISFTPALGVADEDVVINYTMRDADGDVSNSTLTVSVGADSVPTITTTPPDDNGTADITDDINRTYESGLDDNDGSESTSGSFTVTAPDGLGSIAIDGTTVTTGDSVTHSGIGILTVGTIVDNGNGTYTVNYSYDLSAVQTHSAAGNDVVTDTFSVTAVDGDGTPTATASTITIEIVDDVPVAAVDTASTTENTQVTYNVINNDDAGADGGKVLVSASLADNTKGSLSFDTATGEISFTPALGVADEDVVINYTMRDADGDVSNSTLTVSVGADSVPTITTTPPDDNGTADITDDINRTYESGLDDNDGSESTSGSFTVTAPDGLGSIAIDGTTVTTGDSVTHSGIGILTVGTIVDNGNGTYTVNYSYDLSAVQTHSAAGNDVVTDTFSVTAVDGDGTPTATASTITIEIVDDVPVAAVDTASTTENTQVTYNVINNDDAGADGGKVLVSASLADNTKGSLSFDTATGEISFTPALGVADEDVVINYTMRDADGDVSNSTLTVSVGADSVPTITTTPPDDNGTADITDDINRTYESGLDDNDGSESTSGSFTVTAPDGLGSIAIDGTTVTTGDSVTHSGIGILTVGTIVDNGNGTYTVNYSYDLSAVQTHSAAGNDVVTDTFSVTAVDGDGTPTATASTITIEIVDDVPVAAVDTASTTENTQVTYNVINNDDAGADGGKVLVSASLADNTKGSLSFDTATGEISFTPALGVADEDVVINYTMRDADGDVSNSTLTVSVGADSVPTITTTPPDDNGTADITDDINRTYESGLDDNDGSESTSGSFTVTAPDGLGSIAIDGTTVTTGDSVTHSGIGILTVGTIVDNGNGTYTVNYSYDLSAVQTHSAAGNDVVTDTFSVTAVDGDGTPTATASTITIEIVDDVPVANADSGSVTEDALANTVIGNVITGTGFAAADQPGADVPVNVVGVAAGNTAADLESAVTVNTVINGTYGTIIIAANGEYTYTLDNSRTVTQELAFGATPDEVFTYTIRDGDGDLSHTTVTITVNGANDLPESADKSIIINEDETYQFVLTDFAFNDADTADSLQSIRIDSVATEGSLVFDGVVITAANLAAFNGGSNVIDVADLSKFTFVPDLHESGADVYGGSSEGDQQADYASFDFSVSDGNDWSVSSSTITIDVTPDADAPTLSVGATQSGVEGTPIALSAISVGFSDLTDNSETHTLVISDIPAGSVLTDGTHTFTATAAGNSIDATGWDLANLSYTAHADVPDSISENHTLKVTATAQEIADGVVVDTESVVQDLVINVVDTAPVAVSDFDSVGYGGATSGNVITGDGGDSVMEDQLSEDSVTFTTISFGSETYTFDASGQLFDGLNNAVVNNTIIADHGTLQINSDGSYQYDSTDSKVVVSHSGSDLVNDWTKIDVKAFTEGEYDPNSSADLDLTLASVNQVSTNNNRLGVGGNPDGKHIGQDGAGSEALVFSLTTETKIATIDFNGMGSSEQAVIRYYESDNKYIGQKLVSGAGNGTETIQSDTAFQYIVVSALNDDASFRVDGVSFVQANEGSDSFNYTILDSDGDSSAAVLTVQHDMKVTAVDDTAQVSESGLANGTAANTDLEIATGDLLSNDSGITPGSVISQISSDGNTDNSTDANGVLTVVTEHGTIQVYTQDYNGQSAGYYEYELTGATTGDNVTDTITYTVSDGSTTSTATLTIDINDDAPLARDIVQELPESDEVDYNLVFVLDTSGSMSYAQWGGEVKSVDENGNVTIRTRLDMAKAALIELVKEYFAQTPSVELKLITFDNSSDLLNDGNSYSDETSAIAAINAITGSSSTTNYQAALDNVATAFGGGYYDTSANNTVYFLSDGEPTTGQTGTGLDSYDSFLVGKDIDSYAVAIGTGISDYTELNRIHNVDADGSGVKDPAINVPDLDKLDEELLSTVPASYGGNVLTGSTSGVSTFGADGGFVESITITLNNGTADESVIFSYDSVAKEVSITQNGSFLSGFPQVSDTLTLTSAEGFEYGKLVFDFASGDYQYFTENVVSEGDQFSFGFVANDNDGDVAQATTTIKVIDGKPVAENDSDTLFAQSSVFEGNVVSGIGTDGGVNLGAQLTSFTQQGSGVDNAIDDAQVSSVTFKGVTYDLTTDSAFNGSEYGYVISGGELVWTHNNDGSVLTFNVTGYYHYTPPTADIPTNPAASVLTYDLLNNADATSAGVILQGMSSTSSTPDRAITFEDSDGVGVSGGVYPEIDNLESLVITFDRADHPNGVSDVQIDIDGSDSNLGGNNSLTYTIYHLDGSEIGQFSSASEGWNTVPVEYSNIGQIVIQAASGTSSSATYARVSGIRFAEVTIDNSATAIDAEEIGYTLTDTDGDSSDATLTLSTISNTIVGDAAVNNLTGTDGNDRLVGLEGDDILQGGIGHDLIEGGAGVDTISGGAGSDRLLGSMGNDILSGDIGDDILMGGAGNDLLNGGSGSDSFTWLGGDQSLTVMPAVDHVQDFNHAEDLLDLSDLLDSIGAQPNIIEEFLSVSQGAEGTVLSVKGGFGGSIAQEIVLDGIDINTLKSDLGITGGTNEELLNQLILDSKVII